MTNPAQTRPKAMIFDWDNTLVDSWVVIQDALNATFREFAVPEWTLDETKARVAKSLRDSFPELFGEEWEAAGKVFYGHFEAIHLERLTPLPGAGEALAELADMGIYLSVVSNKTGHLLRAEAEKLGWNMHFGQIVGAMDAPHDKPAADPVLMALAGSNIKPSSDVWFVGDSRIDMECAVNTGCYPVLMRADPPTDGEFEGVIPQLHINTPQMLSNLAKNL